MATITTITKSGPGPAPAVPTTAQFKSHVYSKYRELLGSYNDKANDILQTYPAYRVREDTGFALGGETYGGPPQSTIGNSARRIQAQLPAEPPACVQNAMMRRDKQPFTYTPGGIDLSQIKSPRMAKRISRNANSEGVTGQPKVSPLAQNNGSNHNGTSNGSQSSVSPAATLGAAAMGMPFQVFPAGPPAPPPPPPPTGRVVPSNGGNRSVPPPPPPPGPGPALPAGSGSEARKSPRPQSFEPPPMGMRPEIKIPPNPMAALRKAPRPQPKNDFWIEEYRREKQQDEPQIPRPVPPSYSYANRDLDDEVAKNTFNRTDELTVRGDPLAQQKRSPSPSNLTKPLENGARGSSSIKTPPVYGQSPVPANLPPPITPTKVSPTTQASPTTKDTPPPVRPKPSPSPVFTNQSTNNTPTQSVGSAGKDQTAGVKNTAPVGYGPVAPPPPPPLPSSAQKDSQPSVSSGMSPSVSSTSSIGPPSSAPQSPPKPVSTHRPAAQALGSLYIPPIHEVFANSKQSLLTQASPPWMSSRHNSLKEQPEWVHKDEQDSAASNSDGSNAQQQSNEQQQSQEQYKPQPQTVPQRAPSATRESVPSTTKSVDSIVTAPAPVSARPSPSVPSQQLTQNNIRPAAADVSVPVQQQFTPASVQQQQQYAQQVQQAARSVGPPVAPVSQTTVTMPVNRGYPQQAPVYAQAQPVYSTQSPAGTQKERIIPIQIEKSPVQAPVQAPNFAPPPYYSPNAQYGPAGANSSMQSPIPVGFATPHSGFTTPTAMFTNPNHFVNQGYNNISYPPTPTGQPHPLYQHHQHYPPQQTPPVLHHPMHAQPQQQQQQQQQQRMQQQHTPTQQQPANVTNVRIVPIKVEGAEHTVRGPLSNTPAIIQSDPRSSSNTQSWNGNSAPNQSRSFRVLQQITDTLDEAEAEMNAKDQANSPSSVADQTDGSKQQPYGRSAGAGNVAQQQDMAEGQLRRLQLSNEDKALMNRVKNQVDGEVYLHNEEDPRYRGAAIPSKAFRYLQNMTDSGQAANQSNNGSGNRAQQMFNRGTYNDSDGDTQQQSQQYVPPSEQKVEEPKKYTGGSIPSRSFKMLQAMTDAPADPNSSDSEGPSVKLPHGSGTDIRYSPYPYPPQPYFCCPNPNWHYYDPTTNPQYYPPHHPPPPPHAPGYYYPPMPPPPPGHFDRGGGYYGGYMSPHHFYYAQEPCSPCTPPPYYQLSQPQTAYCEAMPSEAIHTYVITTPPPRIVVTPTPDDSCSDSELQAIKEQLGELRNVPGEFAGVEPSDYGSPIPLMRSQSSLKRLSERLTNFNNGCGEPDGPNSSVRCSPCSPLNERYRTYEESTSSVPSSQSEASDSEDEDTSKPRPVSRTRVQSNGHAKDTEVVRLNGLRALAKEKTPEKKNARESESENKDEEDEDEEEEEEDEAESEDEETVEYGGNGEPPVDEHLPHQLSVIFEEESMYGQSTVASRRTSVCSNSSTLSDCSSTLANDLDDEKDVEPSGNRTDDDIDRLDETDMEKSLVSVRLPLKLSFSKSPNNEDIATLVVGESEITGSKEKLANGNRSAQQPEEEDSGDESDTEEESENESAESSEEETDDTDGEDKVSPQKKEANDVTEKLSNEADTDVTVTITIPSLSSKGKLNERESLSRPEAVKHEAPVKAPFKIDYEEASEVSVSVSLPLKPKGSSSSDITKQPDRETPSDEKLENAENANGADGEEEEEVDFWSQIGDEDDDQRPVRSYSRDMWSSREFSVDRQSVWSQDAEEDEEASTTGTTDFWSAENGPTEASDLWNYGKRNSPFPASGDKAETAQVDSKDSLEFWQKENERLVKDLYERRASEIGYQGMMSSGFVKDENNNKTCVPQSCTGAVKSELQNDRKTEDHSEEEVEDGSDSESDNDSEEYETSNTSKEDSEAEQDVGEDLPKQSGTTDPVKKSNDEQMQFAGGIGDTKGDSMSQDDGSVVDKMEKDKKLSVKERISLFETQGVNVPSLEVTSNGRGTVTPTMGSRLRPLSRQRQFCEESEAEDDSGVTSDMSKHISEVETDSECFPEMRKMTRYQRAATHSRLFKLLQDESNNGDSEDEEASEDNSKEQEQNRSNVKQHDAATQREDTTAHPKMMSNPVVNGTSRKTPDETPGSIVGNVTDGRRDRLTLPISHQSSSGNDSLSSSTSSASPVSGTLQNEKLAEELVQSLLMKKKGRLFRNLPLEKLHAAALKILQEDLESNGTISSTEDNMATVDSTPALTPQEFKSEYPTSYSDYYDTWCSDSVGQPNGCYSDTGSDCGMVKMFRTVPEHQLALAKKDSRANTGNGHWSPRCPRVFSNKNIPRLMGVRESDVVEPTSRGSRPPSRASSNRSPFTVITPAVGLFNAGSPMDDCPNRANTANRQFKLQ